MINLALADKLPSHRDSQYKPTDELLKAVEETNILFKSLSAQEMLAWVTKEFASSITLLTSFSIEDVVLIHMIYETGANIKIYNLDTGYQFPETLAMYDKIETRYNIKTIPLKPELTVKEYEAPHKTPLYNSNPNQCCHDRKIKPLSNLLLNFKAWITGIRREQSPTRTNAPLIGWDNIFKLIKINPLASWTREQVWQFIHEHQIPYNELYDHGYLSIGCWPCTKPSSPSDNERAGRWSGFNKTECGLHFDNTKD